METETNRIVQFFETLNSIPLPNWVKKNVLTALGKGIGQVITSGLDWPTAYFETKAKELRAKAEGNNLVQIEASKQAAQLFSTNSELANRALNYYAEKIIEHQVNREDVATNFVSQIPNHTIDEKNQSDIDIDWLNSFWTIAETKSSEEIKFILGKMLAAEVTNPKSISPVTLQLIPMLTTDIGKAFHKLCNISIKNQDFAFVIHPKIGAFMTCGELTEYGISFEEQAELEGIGLIRSINVVSIKISPEEGEYEDCDYAGVKAKMNFSSGVNIIDFTRAGKEIRDLLELTPNEEYTKFLVGLGQDKFKLD